MPAGSLKVLLIILDSFISRIVVSSDGSSSEKTDTAAFSIGREGRVTTTVVTKRSDGR